MANNKLLLHHNLFALQLQHHTYNWILKNKKCV
jgi:hypothetical protein